MNYVLDACAMIAFLRGETGSNVVGALLENPSCTCFAHVINLCEVFYDFVRTAGEITAKSAIRDLASVGIHSRRDISASFWTGVGRLKGTVRRISLADCFAVELARRLRCEVVTSDHHEFDPLAQSGLCRVRFIR
jgi:PIN domain nuclease of toxin-antitoxin system